MPTEKIESEELIEYRLTKLEQQYAEVKSDLKSMMDVLNRIDKRFALVPDGGLNCQIHANLMADMRKEIDNHAVLINGLQSFKWRAVGIISAIVLMMQIFGATLAEKIIKRDTTSIPIKIELSIPGIGVTNVTPKVASP